MPHRPNLVPGDTAREIVAVGHIVVAGRRDIAIAIRRLVCNIGPAEQVIGIVITLLATMYRDVNACLGTILNTARYIGIGEGTHARTRLIVEEFGLVETQQPAGQSIRWRLQLPWPADMAQDIVRQHKAAIVYVGGLIGRKQRVFRVIGDDGVAGGDIVTIRNVSRIHAQ